VWGVPERTIRAIRINNHRIHYPCVSSVRQREWPCRASPIKPLVVRKLPRARSQRFRAKTKSDSFRTSKFFQCESNRLQGRIALHMRCAL
jgi:hypothetical protein